MARTKKSRIAEFEATTEEILNLAEQTTPQSAGQGPQSAGQGPQIQTEGQTTEGQTTEGQTTQGQTTAGQGPQSAGQKVTVKNSNPSALQKRQVAVVQAYELLKDTLPNLAEGTQERVNLGLVIDLFQSAILPQPKGGKTKEHSLSDELGDYLSETYTQVGQDIPTDELSSGFFVSHRNGGDITKGFAELSKVSFPKLLKDAITKLRLRNPQVWIAQAFNATGGKLRSESGSLVYRLYGRGAEPVDLPKVNVRHRD